MDFFNTKTYEQVLMLIDEKYKHINIGEEEIYITDSLGRISSEDVFSSEDLPSFNRSTVDGYSVMSKDTFGASETIPSIHKVIEKVEMGKKANLRISSGETSYIPTGGMMPENSDSVVMVEYSEQLSEDEVALYKGVTHLENVIQVGDDISKGEIIIKKGTKIRPQEIAVMASVGIEKIMVRKKLKCAIISTGDELVDLKEKIHPGKIRDINTYSIEAMLKQNGCEVVVKKLIKDTKLLLESTIKEAIKLSDLILISGGSSVGDRDYTHEILSKVGEVFVYGVALKPGKPTILSVSGEVAIVGLPGHPGATISVFEVIVKKIIKHIEGSNYREPKGTYKFSTNLHSAPGKHTIQLVSVNNGIATPILGKSSMISCLAEADGYIEIPMDIEGLYKNQEVEVTFF